MLVATFGPSTAWLGKKITFKRGAFSLEGHGKITAADVVSYDRQGVLVWPDAKKREWAWEQANRGATVYRAQPAPAKTKKQHGCSWYLAVGVLALFVLALVIAVGAFSGRSSLLSSFWAASSRQSPLW